MYLIYCAFSPILNLKWRSVGEGHVIKIGGAKDQNEREAWLNDGYPVRKSRRTASAANVKGWKIIDAWPVHRPWIDIEKLERDIRRPFKKRCGEFSLYDEIRSEMQKIDRDLNGLSEIVCADVKKLEAVPLLASEAAQRFPETSFLIEKIVDVVRANDANWRDLVDVAAAQAV
jgi:hypothetical protein